MAARFNEAMVARLIELVQSCQDDLNPPTRTAKANEKQKEAWKFVTDSMNREFPQEVPQGGLTIAQIQTKFKNLKQRAKDERQTEKKVNHMFLAQMSDQDLYKRFRFDREGIKYITNLVREEVESNGRSRGGAIPVELQVVATLAYLASNSFQMICGDLLGFDQSTVSRSVLRVTTALRNLAGKFIYFAPYEQAREIIIPSFYNVANFPGVIGAIDCTHVRIIPPASAHEKDYFNRKGYPSINVQGVVDHNGRFSNISCQWPGCSHDAFVLRQSNVWEAFEGGQIQGIILGDSAYPTRRWLMTPFANPTTAAQQQYNYAHAKTRVIVENAFGRWKRRFHILHSEVRIKLQNVPTLITAAAVLHNIAIDRNLPDFLNETFVDNQPSLLQINSLPTFRSLDSFNLRNNIAENFFGGSS